MTAYVVLQKIKLPDENEGWTQAGPPLDALSAEQAIRKVINGRSNGGTFVAIPVRSFAPVSVEVETKQTVRFAEVA